LGHVWAKSGGGGGLWLFKHSSSALPALLESPDQSCSPPPCAATERGPSCGKPPESLRHQGTKHAHRLEEGCGYYPVLFVGMPHP